MDRPLWRSAAGSIVIGNPVTGGGANRVLYEDGSQNLAAASGFTFASNTLTAPTITATTQLLSGWLSNNVAPVSGTIGFGSTATASYFTAIRDGGIVVTRNTGAYSFASSTNPGFGAIDTVISRYAAKQLLVSSDGSTLNGTVVSGLHALGASTESTISTALTANKKVKSVTAIADNVATDTITVTVPNAAHSASLKLTLKGSLGAGGAIGANEATGVISYDVAIARTAGVATVATVSTAYGSATASVAGASTITITAAASAMTGAVGATQTFTIQVTIAKGSGASDNHTCQVLAEIINANATGVTIS